MNYTVSQLATLCNGQLCTPDAKDPQVSKIVYDTRTFFDLEQSLFIAIQGSRRNGHHFIKDAYREGIRCFLISDSDYASLYKDAYFIYVKHTLKALQLLARRHRQQYDLPVIGITGSNGKTIVKEWLFQLLDKQYNIVRSPQSFNSQLGVPLSVLQINEQHDLALFEAGISQVGEMTHLEKIIQPNIGLFTFLGDAHANGFLNKNQKLEEKALLFKNTAYVVYRKKEKLLDDYLSKKGIRKYTWSYDENAALQIVAIEQKTSSLTVIKGIYKNQSLSIAIPFIDQPSIENAIICWLAILSLDAFTDSVKAKFLQLQGIEMRLELLEGIQNCTLINDGYNADMDALIKGLDFLKQHGEGRKRTLILSDFSATSDPRHWLDNILSLCNTYHIQRLIGIGTQLSSLFPIDTTHLEAFSYDTVEDFLQYFPFYKFSHEIILLKGARRFQFERIAERLSKKSHQTKLEINLDALAKNFKSYTTLLGKETKIMAMVKASAYGMGSIEVSRFLAGLEVAYLGVAFIDEGIALREAGIRLPILVLNPAPSAATLLIKYQLEAEIYSIEQWKALLSFPASAENILFHLNIDTGMHRLGLVEKDVSEIRTILEEFPTLNIKSIFTHLVAASTPSQDDFTRQQLRTYEKMYDKIATQLAYQPIQHLLNSGGATRFPQYAKDMVRLGIGLYGFDEHFNGLEAVHSLKAYIVQIKELAKGATVGYERLGKITRPSRIATVNIGYADGLLRKAGNGNFGLKVRGKIAPTIGNISMDMCTIDITAIPEAKTGDEVIIFDETHPVRLLADCLNTIPYEIFTGIAERVKRVYIRE